MADNLKKLDYVVGITQSMAMTPYVGEYAWYDSIRVEGKMYRVNYKGADEEACKVFHLEIVEANGSRTIDWRMDRPFVSLRNNSVDKLKWTQTLGRKIFMRGNNFTVTGCYRNKT